MDDFIRTSLRKRIEEEASILTSMSDTIFDLAEPSFQEIKSCRILEDYLRNNGFAVEHGVGKLNTAFRAVYENGTGGPSIGLLCEYDALKDIGHACGHHLQGPAVAGAAVAVKDKLKDVPYKLVVYGTPGEETTGGKADMLAAGCFQDIDVALMTHGGPATQVDVKSMALTNAEVVFHGCSAHAAINPDKGRSALDALLLTFNGIEFLREHVKDDTRINYTVSELPGPANVVPDRAAGNFDLRSYNSVYLDGVVKRFENIIKGAALMTETTYEINYSVRFDSKIPSYILNDILMENAKIVDAPCIRPAREKTGSTDFGNVTFCVPGACIRVAFVPEGSPSHSQEFLNAGKMEAGHQAVIKAAEILAFTAAELCLAPELIEKIKKEFTEIKQNIQNE